MEQSNEQNEQSGAKPAVVPSVTQLLQESWQFTKERLDLVAWYVLISLAPLVFILVPGVLAAGIMSAAPQYLWVAIIVGLLALLGLLWFMIVASAGLFYAVAQTETTKFAAGWHWARGHFWQIAWLGLLVTLVLVTGFSLLLLPGLIIMIYTMFYFLGFALHEHRGLHALAASTHLVYGRFWAVLGRFAAMIGLILLVSIGITLVFEMLGNLTGAAALAAVGEVVNTIVSFILTIVLMRYMVLLYRALTAQVPAYQAEPHSTSYKLYRVFAWFGIVPAVIIPSSIISLVLLFPSMLNLQTEAPTPAEVISDEMLQDLENLEAEIEMQP